MSQKAIREGIQDTLQALAAFADADVTLSNLDILDEPGALESAPFVVILPPGSFDVISAPARDFITWQIPALVYTAFDASNTTWASAFEEHAANEQTVIDALQADQMPTTTSRITMITGTQDILEDVTNDPVSFIFRPLIIEVEEDF